mmetsp:Transcript_31358/g.68698  ORF Transcript_31358/g.68698 Transcript_31358/m.68698 type:complete len:284 (-) Transcript_31358:1277-2128(-)
MATRALHLPFNFAALLLRTGFLGRLHTVGLQPLRCQSAFGLLRVLHDPLPGFVLALEMVEVLLVSVGFQQLLGHDLVELLFWHGEHLLVGEPEILGGDLRVFEAGGQISSDNVLKFHGEILIHVGLQSLLLLRLRLLDLLLLFLGQLLQLLLLLLFKLRGDIAPALALHKLLRGRRFFGDLLPDHFVRVAGRPEALLALHEILTYSAIKTLLAREDGLVAGVAEEPLVFGHFFLRLACAILVTVVTLPLLAVPFLSVPLTVLLAFPLAVLVRLLHLLAQARRH